jgi:hypothetical protein
MISFLSIETTGRKTGKEKRYGKHEHRAHPGAEHGG